MQQLFEAAGATPKLSVMDVVVHRLLLSDQPLCPLFSHDGTRVPGSADLLTGRDGDRMSMGSAERPPSGHQRKTLEYASWVQVPETTSLRP